MTFSRSTMEGAVMVAVGRVGLEESDSHTSDEVAKVASLVHSACKGDS